MKKWGLLFLGIAMMLALAVPALAETGTPDNEQEAVRAANAAGAIRADADTEPVAVTDRGNDEGADTMTFIGTI